MTTNEINDRPTIVKAIYTNTFTKEQYKLSFELKDGETPLGAAWQKICGTVCIMTGWNHDEIFATVS